MADPTISAQVSVYPLRQEHLTPAIQAVTAAVEDAWIARGGRAHEHPG